MTNFQNCDIIYIESEVRNIQDNKPKPRAPSAKERVKRLLAQVSENMKNGDTAEEALEKLTPAQYDFLIDQDIDFDTLLLSPEQIKAISKVTRSPRPTGLVYNKKYPRERQDLYKVLTKCIEDYGADEVQLNKNFRDLDFKINGVKYKIVLSNPRTPKN